VEAQHSILKGIPAAPGLAQGKIVIVAHQALAIPEHTIDDVEGEISRLDKARQVSKAEILELKEMVKSGTALQLTFLLFEALYVPHPEFL